MVLMYTNNKPKNRFNRLRKYILRKWVIKKMEFTEYDAGLTKQYRSNKA